MRHRFIGVGFYALHVAIHVSLKTGKNTVQYAHATEMLKKLILKGKNPYLKHKINHWEPIPLCKQGAANESVYNPRDYEINPVLSVLSNYLENLCTQFLGFFL